MSARLVKLEPPAAARLTVAGRELSLRAVAMSAAALRLEPAPGLGAGASCRVRVEGGLELDAAVEGVSDEGALLRLMPGPGDAERIEAFLLRHRKADHIRICRDEDVQSVRTSTGLGRWRLPHRALPELDLRKVSLETSALGRRLKAPVLISCMTGGSELAKTINRRLAAAAQRHGFALGLGSQRALLDGDALLDTYDVRSLCPDVLLFGNVGAVQLNRGLDAGACRSLVERVRADALVLHLNALQEAVQPEGDVDFSGLRAKIAALAEALPFPLLLKEVGNGIDAETARWAAGTRLAGLDAAGAGGTSWARVESRRAGDPVLAELGRSFAGWGVPTAESIRHCRAALPDRLVIGSGGVRDGIEAAAALALGADLVGLARPFLAAAAESEEALDRAARLVVEQLRVAMFLAGARDVAELKRLKLEEA